MDDNLTTTLNFALRSLEEVIVHDYYFMYMTFREESTVYCIGFHCLSVCVIVFSKKPTNC